MYWGIDIARKVYGLENYARESVVDVDEEGFLSICLEGLKIKVKDLMDSFNLSRAYIRILPAIRRSMDLVINAYKIAAELMNYNGGIIPIYPLKVNPTPLIVETIAEYGEKYGWGFSAGSLGEIRVLQKLAGKISPRTLIYDGVILGPVLQELLEFDALG